jgi:hypothetical protein
MLQGARTSRQKNVSQLPQHLFGADLYCQREPFGADQYCKKEPFGADAYLDRVWDDTDIAH